MTHQRPALDLLNDIGRGKLSRELTEALHELNKACLERVDQPVLSDGRQADGSMALHALPRWWVWR